MITASQQPYGDTPGDAAPASGTDSVRGDYLPTVEPPASLEAVQDPVSADD